MNAVAALCHYCEKHGPKIVFCSQAFHEDSNNASCSNIDDLSLKDFYGDYGMLEKPDDLMAIPGACHEYTSTCVACRSSPNNKPSFLTNDHENRTSYVSSQFPYHGDVFSLVRGACVRSLSNEIFPEGEGPVFFGDPESGYALGYGFYMKDLKARGLQSWHSLLLVSVDRLLLMNQYRFFVRALESIAEELRWKANVVFDRDQADCPDTVTTMKLMASDKASSIPANVLPGGRRRIRSGNSQRALTELTADPDIFRRLHNHFVWVLKAGAERIGENVLEGSHSEDDQTRQEMLAASFGNLPASRSAQAFVISSTHSSTASTSHAIQPGQNGASGSAVEFYFPSADSTADQLNTVEHLALMWHAHRSCMTSLSHHLLIGNQVIIQGPSEPQVRALVMCLANILPVGCLKCVPWSDRYLENWKCNLLGLPESINIKAESGYSVIASITGVASSGRPDVSSIANSILTIDYITLPWKDPSAASCGGGDGSGCGLKQPILLERLNALLMNKSTCCAFQQTMLKQLKQEWLAKAKMFWAFIKQKPDAAPEEMHQFLLAMKCSKSDQDVLKHWTAGLSRSARKHILSVLSESNAA